MLERNRELSYRDLEFLWRVVLPCPTKPIIIQGGLKPLARCVCLLAYDLVFFTFTPAAVSGKLLLKGVASMQMH